MRLSWLNPSAQLNETGVSVPLDSMETQKLECVISSFADEALRTLCFAYKELDGLPERGKEIPKTGLTFVAIVGIKDPVRPGVNDAVNICFKAGIRVRMVTGDNLKTAMAIARECNILTDDGLAIEGYVFRRWSLEEKSKNIPRLQVKVVWDKMATVGQVDMCELVLMALHRLTYKLQELCYDYNCWSRMESIAALLSSYTLPNWRMWASRSFSLFSENVVYLTCGGFAMAAIKGMIKKGAKGCCMPPP